jgi:hypothetical protein
MYKLKLKPYYLIGFAAIFLSFLSARAQNQLPSLHWKLAPQSSIPSSPGQISSPGFSDKNWTVAVVPGTAFYAYVAAGKEANPDYADQIYKVDKTKYDQPFWYRTEINLKLPPNGKRLWLYFNGIHKRGEIYFNGKHLGTLKGLVERGIYDVTGLIHQNSQNALAVLVVPPLNDPAHHHGLANWESPTYLSSGSWDWMPAVPGLNSGITDTVALRTTGPVRIVDPYVQTLLPDLHTAKLTVHTGLQNAGSTSITGVVHVVINPGHIVLTSRSITLPANSQREFNFNSEEFSQLRIKNPKLWWPNGYGGKSDGTQYLYTCTMGFNVNRTVSSDEVNQSFGIRKITSDTTALHGPLRIYINNVPVMIKGGNWGMSDYMLKVRGKDYETRIKLHQAMNFNMIRNWTGEVTDEAFYRYCDKYGIMVWDDFWLNNMGGIDSIAIFKANADEKVKKLRNHPSVVIWCGANEGVPGGNPNGDLSEAIKSAIQNYDHSDRIYLPRSNAGVTNPNFSVHGGSHNLSGSGLWGNTDPKTYFTDPHNGYLFSAGSYGLRSELGTATFVNVESFKKFMPKAYWVPPTPDSVNSKTNMWARHYFSTDGDLGGGSQPVHYINDVNRIYGQSNTIEDFCKRAQLMNVETMKAMYEAWNDHMWNDASGMLIWMSQSAYPTLIWQTYDYYYDLTGAYFGAKMACEPVHIQWNAATNSVKVINNRPYKLKEITAEATVYNMSGRQVAAYHKKATLNADATSAKEAFTVFQQNTQQTDLSNVFFLKLKLTDKSGKLLSDNFYWLGKKYQDYTALNQLPSVGASLRISKPVITPATDKENRLITYIVSNQSAKIPAFAIRTQLLNGRQEQILPVIVSNSYYTLLPGEHRQITVEVEARLLKDHYQLHVQPYN